MGAPTCVDSQSGHPGPQCGFRFADSIANAPTPQAFALCMEHLDKSGNTDSCELFSATSATIFAKQFPTGPLDLVQLQRPGPAAAGVSEGNR